MVLLRPLDRYLIALIDNQRSDSYTLDYPSTLLPDAIVSKRSNDVSNRPANLVANFLSELALLVVRTGNLLRCRRTHRFGESTLRSMRYPLTIRIRLVENQPLLSSLLRYCLSNYQS